MKEKCDNHCETCSLTGQIFCALMFSRATNQSLPTILERLESLEMEMQDLRKPKDVPKVLNPMGYQVEDAEEL
jgi:hypothetical protein